MTWSILDSYSIDQKEHPIDRKEFSIDQKIEEIHHKVYRWLDRFSILFQSIERNIWSIKGNSWLAKTHETEFF